MIMTNTVMSIEENSSILNDAIIQTKRIFNIVCDEQQKIAILLKKLNSISLCIDQEESYETTEV